MRTVLIVKLHSFIPIITTIILNSSAKSFQQIQKEGKIYFLMISDKYNYIITYNVKFSTDTKRRKNIFFHDF